ncbi:DUF2795 domain-containing protein [Streptomyces chartreusis]|uniref:DUF2795 domain-containing protein n=1 Tax=Streptomyces chartreusis TaxID=1969 RepID=UPI0035D6ADBD
MQRGSDRLSVHRDDEMKHELQGLLRSGHPTRTEEWHDPEPSAEDDPQVAGGPVAPGTSAASLATVRLELARFLGRSAFPATPRDLIRELRRGYAPDALVESLERLSRTSHYANVQELAEAVTGEERQTAARRRSP